MTASASFRSRSLCQTYSASHPKRSLATWKQSASQLDPGKTTIANFTRSPSPGDLDVESLDDRVGQELLGHFARIPFDRGRVGSLHVQKEDLSGSHVPDAGVA